MTSLMILNLIMLMQKTGEHQQVDMCFVYYRNAFACLTR